MKFSCIWKKDWVLDIFEGKQYVGQLYCCKPIFAVTTYYDIYLSWSLVQYFGQDIINNINYKIYHSTLDEARNEIINLYNKLIKTYKMKVFI